jgi:hypothetical protein
MNRCHFQFVTGLLLLTGTVSTALAASITPEQVLAQKAVAKVVKNPEELKFGTFTIAGPHGACLTVFKKNWQSIGSHEAFLMRKGDDWEALYVVDTPGGHEGCVAEMSKR